MQGVAFTFLVFIPFSCGSGLREAPRGPHPATYAATPIVVDSEPPPAEIDVVPPPPSQQCFWSDGYWLWNNGGWKWTPGKWVRDPGDCYYADSFMTWVPNPDGSGTLYYTQGRWYHRQSGDFCPEPSRCLSSATSP